MEHELWGALYDLVTTTDYDDPATGVTDSDRVIVLACLWAVLHDRPTQHRVVDA